jgi:hypothetical protein
MCEEYIMELGFYRNGEVLESTTSQEWAPTAYEKKIKAEQTSL